MSKPRPPFHLDSIWIPRSILLIFLLTTVFLPNLYAPIITTIYSHLYKSPIYNASSIETLEIIFFYALLEPIYVYRFANNPNLRIDLRPAPPPYSAPRKDPSRPNLPPLRRPSARLQELFIFLFPLVTLDLTLIKKYADVPLSAIRTTGNYPALPPANQSSLPIKATFLVPTLHNFTRSSPLQLIRALPHTIPSSRRLVLELLMSIALYDTIFFLFHLLLHRVPLLRRFHTPHHAHAEINAQVTNQLTVVERLGLILGANFSLNIIGAHVLTRSLFVPLFVYLLIEVHCGLELDWGYHRILPSGWGAGSRLHARHHRVGDRGYQPFFCWWDGLLETIEGRWYAGKPIQESNVQAG